MRRFGMFENTYGRGGMPPLPKPPEAQDWDCQPVSVPSFLAAILIFAKADGRLPAMVKSVARSRNRRTGRPPLFLERRAPITAQRSLVNLLPNPPPMFS